MNNPAKQYEALLEDILEKIADIDMGTPIEDPRYPIEPDWWLNMMTLERIVRKLQKKLRRSR